MILNYNKEKIKPPKGVYICIIMLDIHRKGEYINKL